MKQADSTQEERGSFPDGWVVQLAAGNPAGPDAAVTGLHPATVRLSSTGVSAEVGEGEWSWLFDDLEEVFHGGNEPWTILAVPGVGDFGVAVAPSDAPQFRHQLDDLLSTSTRVHHRPAEPPPAVRGPLIDWSTLAPDEPAVEMPPVEVPEPTVVAGPPTPFSVAPGAETAPSATENRARERIGFPLGRGAWRQGSSRNGASSSSAAPALLAGLQARSISAWFGTHLVLDRVSLEMVAGQVTALIGPSGCGKSTFLRILNRMHELIPSAALAGEVLLDGIDVYDPSRKVTDARRQIGMVFQKPNPFPAMSIYDNVLASFTLTGQRVNTETKDEVVESCLRKAGLWNEVRERLRQPGGSLSGGQQQRLCIARALAIKPRVLLMDEPCSALDPTSTRRIEQTIAELKSEVTIVIVTHNMQQAARVSDQCAFFLAEQNTPGVIVEHGPTDAMFHAPQDSRTSDYVNGRFG
ncbi:MAG TPA: phosphate ABC transporter ATP-binding protein [Acidimicrobiales bacterium]